MKNYIIEFENYEDFTLSDFIDVIKKTDGIPLNELKVKDLTYCNDEFIEGGCGVYIFKEKEDIILVGKAETVSFTERIAKHFDLRTNAWFNRLLYTISMKKLGFDKKDENVELFTFLSDIVLEVYFKQHLIEYILNKI